MKKTLVQLMLLLLLFAIPISLSAHQPDYSYIYLRVYEKEGIDGKFDFNINEFNEALGLNLPKFATYEEIAPHTEAIKAYLLKHASFSSVYGEHKILFTDEITRLRTDYGYFYAFHFHLENTETLPDELEVTFSAFLEEDMMQQNMLGMEYNWKAGLINNETIMALVFTKAEPTKTLDLTETSLWNGFMAMVKQGIWHIWIGIDHILFLLALILPSVVRRRKKEGPNEGFEIWGWEPVQKFRPAFIYIIKVITFFTIAHTITLSLASLNIITLPSRLVESIIAISIGLAAYHNIRPIFKGRDWIIAFVFGLFHGFGFASVLADLGFKGEFLTLSLLGFNIGVEIGQVAIIAVIFPILYLIRRLRLYPKFLVFLSAFLILISLYWFVERAFDIDLPIDDYIRREGFKIAQWLGLR